MSVTAAPLEDSKSTFLGVVITARDLTHLEDLDKRGPRSHFHRFVGKSQAMQRIYALIESVGKVDTTVLITGESGTGKELVADALHEESPRRNRSLVKVDCTAIPEELLESELFGHKKGSFTGSCAFFRKEHFIPLVRTSPSRSMYESLRQPMPISRKKYGGNSSGKTFTSGFVWWILSCRRYANVKKTLRFWPNTSSRFSIIT
jgi:hypothetical protein